MGEKNISVSLQKACFNENRSTLRFCFLVSALLWAAPLQSTFPIEEGSRRKLTASKDLETGPFPPSGVQSEEMEETLFFEYDSVTKLGYAPYHKPTKDRSKSLLPQKGETPPISQVLADDQRCQLVFKNEEPVGRERLGEVIAPESDEREESGGWERNTKTGDWPYSIHGRLQMTFQKETLMGSGVMVGPRHVFTAAHNLYDHDRGGWAKEVIFAPGRNEDTYPFGDARGCKLLTFKEWVDPANRDKDAYDLGLVILDSPLGDYTGWSGLLSGPVILFEGREISLTGYPGNKGKGRYQTTQMWTGRGEIESSVKRGEQFLYKMETFRGQSGSALWDEKEIVTFGIHSKEEKGKDNLGVRLSEAKFKCILEEWLGVQNREGPLTAPVGPDEASGLQDIDVNTWMQRAEAGELHAQYELGRRYYRAKKVKQAFLCLRKAAENEKGKTNIPEYAEALTLLGQCYEKGEGVTQNTLQALLLYKKALENNPNNTEAQCRLGACYLEGWAGLKKEGEAVRLLKEAVKGRSAEAFYLLGRCYEEGRGVLKTPEEAYKFYKQAEKRGYSFPTLITASPKVQNRIFCYFHQENNGWVIRELLLVRNNTWKEIQGGSWNNYYPATFLFHVNNKTYLYQHRLSQEKIPFVKSHEWNIRKVHPDGKIGKKTMGGYWGHYYPVDFPLQIGTRVFYYSHMKGRAGGIHVGQSGYWALQELLPQGKMGQETDNGHRGNYYPVSFPFEVGGKTFHYGHREDGYWYIQELLPQGKMGQETDNGHRGNYYPVSFPFEIGGKTFHYGHRKDGYWYIQELLPQGKMGQETGNGYWRHYYPVSFPFEIGGKTFHYGHRKDGYWYIQELLPQGKMGDLITEGHWESYYPISIPFSFKLREQLS
jgi:V8-like Glu-specific endopeptidase